MATGTRRLVIVVATAALTLAAPAAANAAWGSIALDPQTGKAGVAFEQPNRNAAKQAAVKDCPQGSSCRPALIVRNKCGAIAANTRRYVPGFGLNKRDAIKNARKKAKKGPGPAKLIAFVCSG